MLLGYREKATVSSWIADPRTWNECRQPPLATRRFNNYFSMPERRRIVALVRRMVLKKLRLLRVAKKMERCDDLLTMAVDKEDRAGL
jgi:hypothetical protein